MNKIIFTFVVGSLLTGCSKYATKADLNALSANLEKTAIVANRADETANKALSAGAYATDQVNQLRETTAVCCAENRARLDALFEKAMVK